MEKRDYEAEYKKSVNEALTKAGFDSDKLTEDQRYIIMEPNEAPENYHCDGEISPNQAKQRWLHKLRNCGLTPVQVKLAIKYVFG